MRAALLVLLVLGGCAEPDAPWTAAELQLLSSLSPLPPPPPSPGNAHADDPAAAALGKALFFDRRLSDRGRVACADCHAPDRAFTDGLPRAIGVDLTDRHTPTLLGAPHQTFLGWDGRWDSLWSQALAPLEDPREHGTTRTAVARVVALHHQQAWEAAFGPLPELPELPDARPVPGDPLHPHHQAWLALPPQTRDDVDRIFTGVGKALEAWQRTLAPEPAPFDRYVAALLAGDPQGGGHLSDSALRGLRDFLGPGQCIHCHSGPLLSDRAFHVLGLPGATADRAEGARLLLASPFRCGTPSSDARGCPELAALDPELPAFRGAVRTPTLRNVARTGPYMHTGALRTLPEVIDFYRELPGEPEGVERDHLLGLIEPSIDPFDLADFLTTLTHPATAPPPALEPPPNGGSHPESRRDKAATWNTFRQHQAPPSTSGSAPPASSRSP